MSVLVVSPYVVDFFLHAVYRRNENAGQMSAFSTKTLQAHESGERAGARKLYRHRLISPSQQL